MPGLAHFFVFWGFIILTFTIIEAVGALFQVDFAIPLIGQDPRARASSRTSSASP